MGITILSTAFFGQQTIVNAALFKGKEVYDEKGLDFEPVQNELLSSKSLEEFKEKFDKYFEGELGINIYKGENKS